MWQKRKKFMCEYLHRKGLAMLEIINNNLPTILVALVLIGIVILAFRSIQKDKKSGKSCSCGGSCGGCAGSGSCHPDKQQ